jgi:hypothetical protein
VWKLRILHGGMMVSKAKPKKLDNTLLECHFVHHKSHMRSRYAPRAEAGTLPPNLLWRCYGIFRYHFLMIHCHLTTLNPLWHYRKKRGIADIFIAPGTKWCGHKRLANDYVDLGGLSNLDRCCRRHDLCPHSISGFCTKYHLFNYRPFSVSHCHCDKR